MFINMATVDQRSRNDRMLLESNDEDDRGEFDWRWVTQDDRDFTWELAR